MPQAPQWATLEAGSTSQPLASLPSQLARPPVQTVAEHAPAMQVRPAVQALPAVPQLALVVTSSSQPSARLPLALAQPGAQVRAQVPVAQVGVEWAPAVHATLQPPQWVSVLVATSQPSAAEPLQLARPASQVATPHVPLVQTAVALASEQADPLGALGLEHRPVAGLHTPAV